MRGMFRSGIAAKAAELLTHGTRFAVKAVTAAGIVKRSVRFRPTRASLTVAACAACAAATIAGCTTPYRSIAADVPASNWTEPVELTLPNTDTLDCYDWQLFVRNDERIVADTFTLRITVTSPDSLRFGETFFVRMPAAQSTPAALLRETIVDYRRKVRLHRAGDYRLTIEPLCPLQGIEAVGIQTVKSN